MIQSKATLFSLFFLASSAFGFSQSSNEFFYKKYIAYKAIDSIIIDGNANEKSWKNIAWSQEFIDIEGILKPTYNTKMKMLWDNKYLYVFAELQEPHVWATIKDRDAVIFHNNDFEVFIDPDGDTHNYYEIEINALNTIWDLFLTKPYREGNVVLNDWTATGMRSAVSVEGTINNPTDTDKGWAVEIAIPWSVFKKSYYEKNIPIDSFWRINFSRVNWDFQLKDGRYERKKDEKGKLLHEYNWVWSPTGKINMHMPENWGYVYFSSKEAGDEVVFNIPKDEKIKWYLYKIHRLQKSYHKKHKSYTNKISNLNQEAIKIRGYEIKPKIEIHNTGYNISVVSPFSKRTLIVKEDGKFISKWL